MNAGKSFQVVGNDISDGYHTFDELYTHRIELFLAVCFVYSTGIAHPVWRSRLHADGTMDEGWFILGIDRAPGKQITYHLPLAYWEDASFAETLDRAPEWDGHTPADILDRLRRLYR